jgi:hypothetical protein
MVSFFVFDRCQRKRVEGYRRAGLFSPLAAGAETLPTIFLGYWGPENMQEELKLGTRTLSPATHIGDLVARRRGAVDCNPTQKVGSKKLAAPG